MVTILYAYKFLEGCITMARAQLSQDIHCPIPVALPAGEYYNAGTPVFGIGQSKIWNKERPGEMYTAWNFHELKKKKPLTMPMGMDIKLLGVTTESTMGQSICSVQGAGVVNIKASCMHPEILKRKLKITDKLYVFYNPNKRTLTKVALRESFSDPAILQNFMEIGKVHHVYGSDADLGKIHSVDVRLNTGFGRTMQYLQSQAPTPAPAAAARPIGGGGRPAPIVPAPVPAGGAPDGGIDMYADHGVGLVDEQVLFPDETQRLDEQESGVNAEPFAPVATADTHYGLLPALERIEGANLGFGAAMIDNAELAPDGIDSDLDTDFEDAEEKEDTDEPAEPAEALGKPARPRRSNRKAD